MAEWIDYSKDSKGAYRLYKMTDMVDEEEKLKIMHPTIHGVLTEQWFLTEDGLYEVLMQSRKPNAQGQKLVSGRELHEVLGIGRDFTTWMKKMIEYGFVENVDFTTIWNDTKTGVVVEYSGNSNSMVKRGCSVDYILTLEMAKHIAMVQRTEIGMQVRNYFLECEKYGFQENVDYTTMNIVVQQV